MGGQGIVKWLWGSFGVSIFFFFFHLWLHLLKPIKLGICAIPVFFKLPGVSSNDLGIRTQGSSRIVIWHPVLTPCRVCDKQEVVTVWVWYVLTPWDSGWYSLSSDAMGRVLYSWKDLQDLAGYTARVSELLDTMSDVRAANFKKSMIGSASEGENVKRTLAQRESNVFSLTRSSQCCRVVAKSLSPKRSSLKAYQS